MKITKWTVDKQEGMGGSSGHFMAFSAGFCERKHTEEFSRLILLTTPSWDAVLRSVPERYAGPDVPRPFWPCADVPWCRWSAGWSRTFPFRLCYLDAGLSRSVSGTHGRSFCSDKERNDSLQQHLKGQFVFFEVGLYEVLIYSQCR